MTADELRLIGSMATAIGAVVAALIVGIAGNVISVRYSKERDKQQRESDWRNHAVELTKLDLQRKLASWTPDKGPLRPTILDFLANYRDLQQLEYSDSEGTMSPADLYIRICNDRINSNVDLGEDADLPDKTPGEHVP